jgi:A/G-specific adenine glycosylase
MNLTKRQQNSESREEAFRAWLLAWYDAQARDLPWRKTHDPYRVWVSEIMLQQTRVAAVIEHYHEFLRRFPNVEKLAAARESAVLAAWSGLGYYRRARMLHAAAKIVVGELGGRFPSSPGGWRELPGIGRYTAAAIASIAFGEAAAVVDGNVERVLQRVAGRRLVGEQRWGAAEAWLDRERPGDFNQAMMELGATVCTPRAPACLTCPVIELCAARGELDSIGRAPRQKKREIHYLLDCRRKRVFLVQRPADASLMPGMWELPEISISTPDPWGTRNPLFPVFPGRNGKARTNPGRRDKTRKDRAQTGTMELLFTVRHSITLTNYTAHVWRGSVRSGLGGEWVSADLLGRVALTGLARKALRKAALISDGESPASSR